MREALFTLVDRFEANPPLVRQYIQKLADSDSFSFGRVAATLLQDDSRQWKQGDQYLLSLLMSRNLLLPLLSDPDMLTPEQAISLAKAVSRMHSGFERDLLKLLTATPPPTGRVMCRILDILGAVSDPDRLIAQLSPLLRHPDGHVQSKAALILSRGRRQLSWLEQQLQQPDPRLRANSVEAMWSEQDSSERRAVYRTALHDPHNRTVANAIVGMHQLGDVEAARELFRMLSHPKAAFRASAAWAAGATKDPRFLEALKPLVSDADPCTQKHAQTAQIELRKRWNRSRKAGQLEIAQVGPASISADQVHRLIVVRRDGKPIDNLGPLQFIVRADGEVVTEYSVTPAGRPDSIAWGCAAPIALLEDDALGLSRALEQCQENRRRGDTWITAPYAPPPSEPQIHVEFAGQDVSGRVAKGERLMAVGVSGGARELLAFVRQARGARQLILICNDECDSDVSPRFEQELLTCRIALHVIAAPAAPRELIGISERTGGRRAYCEPAQAGAVLLDLVQALSAGYELSIPSGIQNTKLTIISDYGFGETQSPHGQ